MKKIIYILTAAIALALPRAGAIELTADECRQMALQSDERARVANNDVEAARLDREVARTAYLPKFDGSLTGAWMWPETETNGTTLSLKGAYMAGINLTQPVFAGGKIIASNRLAAVGQRVAAQQRRKTRMEIVADADNAYWNYVAVLSKVDMARAYLAQIDTAYRQTLVGFEAGMLTRNDLLRVEARRSQVDYQLQQAEAGADLCRMAVCRAIGVELTTPVTPRDTEIPVEEMPLGDYNLADRPEIQLLQEQIEAKIQQKRITRADFLPTVGLQFGWSTFGNVKMKGFYNDQTGQSAPFSQKLKGHSWLGLVSLSVPLFHWGEGYKKVKRAQVDIETARLNLDYSRKMMELEVEQAIKNVLTSRSLIATAETALRQADESLRNILQRYEVGMSSLTDLLDGQAQWHASYSNLIEARAQYHLNTTEYLRVTGQLPIKEQR